MRGNQAVEVVAGWACFHSRDEILKVRSPSKPTLRLRRLRGTQRAFRNRFNVAPRNPVPDRKSIITWVIITWTSRQTWSTTRRKTGVPRPIRSSENIEAVRASILQSPRHSARKYAFALGLSDRSVIRILHDDLHCHPHRWCLCRNSPNVKDGLHT